MKAPLVAVAMSSLLLGACPEPEKVIVYVPYPAEVGGDVSADGASDVQTGNDGATLPDPIIITVEIAVPDPGPGDDGPGITCSPDAWYCIDNRTSAKCNGTGDGHAEYWNCKPAEICSQFTGRCEEVICLPGEKQCASDNAWTLCGPDGTSYLPPTLCGEDQLCNGQGTCVLASCIGTVLFLVDVSSSMGTHWEAVKGSVSSLEGNNPFARFGLWTFPKEGTICETNDAPAVPIGDASMPQILNWFDTHNPYGQTPLVEAYQNVLTNAATLFNGQGGSVVVLSDGADTCAYPEMVDPIALSEQKIADLTQVASALYANHDVTTYVIGYEYTGDPAQLNAMAANGGTDYLTYTEAGSEQELANALIEVLDDLKLCLGP